MSNRIEQPLFLDQCMELANDVDADAIAIVAADGTTTTRRELKRMAEAVAARLTAAALAPRDRVAILARKSPETIAAFLGASLAGIVYIPLDGKAAPEYWRAVMSDLNVRALLTDRTMAADAFSPVRLLPLAGGPDKTLAELAIGSAVARPRNSHDDAYVLATSGSTGRPKGVLLSHANALSFVDWAIREIGLRSDDTVLGIAPFHFDLSVFDIYAAMQQRARLVLAPELATTFPGLIVEAIEANQVSVLYTVPTILRTLHDTGAFAGDAATSLRVVIYAGEPFPAPALARLMRALPHVAFFNFFGPTETNVCLAHRLTAPPADSAEIPIGTPASFADIRLVDQTGAAVAGDAIGEIMVDGPTVMKGYIAANGFTPAPRPFATGDFARRGPDNALYFCGRRDQQVKVRGMRIELQGVDDALFAWPGVTEVATFVIGQDLVACIGADEPIDEAALAAACRSRLPPGSQPHRFVRFASFPRLSNGKVDRVILKAQASRPKSGD